MERKVYIFKNARIPKMNYLLHLPKAQNGEKLPMLGVLCRTVHGYFVKIIAALTRSVKCYEHR